MTAAGPGFQTLLARVLVRPELLRELHADPDAFAARHGADAEAARRLCRADLGRLDLTARMTVVKRRRDAWRPFPAAASLLPELGWNHDAVRRSGVAEAVDPVRLRERLTALAGLLAAARATAAMAEIIRYEVLLSDLAGRRPAHQGSHPALRPGVAVATFDMPVAKAYRRVLTGRPHTDVPAEVTHYVLRAASGQVRVRQVSAPIRDVLAACDGETSPERVADHLGLPRADVIRLIDQATEQGFLG